MYVSIRFLCNSTLLMSSKNKRTSPAFVVHIDHNMITQQSISHCYTMYKKNQCNHHNKALITINYPNSLNLYETSTYNMIWYSDFEFVFLKYLTDTG